MTDIKYVAFDVHKSTISIVVLNLDGMLVTQAVIQTEAAAIRDFLKRKRSAFGAREPDRGARGKQGLADREKEFQAETGLAVRKDV